MVTGCSPDQCRLIRIQLRGDAVDRVGDRWQLVADAVIEGEFARNLPFVERKEPVAPFGHAPSDFRARRGEGLGYSEDKIGWRVTGQRSVECEPTAGAVNGGPARGKSPELKSAHDVVGAVAPADLFGYLDGAVVLIPVGGGVGQAVEPGDVEVGNPGVVVSRISGEPRDSQVGSRACLPTYGKRIGSR